MGRNHEAHRGSNGDPEAELRALTPRLRRIDDTPPPTPAFVRHLEETVMDTAGHAPTSGFHAPFDGGAANHRPPLRLDAHPQRRRWPISQVAVAAVLILALATAYVAHRPPPSDDGGGEDETRLAAIRDGSSATETPKTTDTAGCNVAPRTENILQWEGTELGLPGTPSATVRLPSTSMSPSLGLGVLEPDLPMGEAAAAPDVAGIEATLVELIVCTASGTPEQTFALYTDDYFRRPSTSVDGGLNFLPLPSRAEHARLVSVRDARVLPDSRIGAVVEHPSAVPTFVVFAKQDNRWLIDEWGRLYTTPGGLATRIAKEGEQERGDTQ